MSYYPERDISFRDKVKVVSHYQVMLIKEELKDATGIETSNLAAKSNFIALKAKVDRLDINKLVNIPTSLKK